MLNVDILTIIVSVVVLFLALLTPFINPFFRKVSNKRLSKDENKAKGLALEAQELLPPISVLLTPTDNAEVLLRNLPLYLNQDYPGKFQVVVVVQEKDKETEDVLKQFACENLYITFVPNSSRYMSRKKLAITLGVKAAKHNWIAMVDVSCKPMSEEWLRELAGGITDATDLVVGNTEYEESTADFLRFERLYTAQYLQREYAFSTPYRCEDSALLFKKDMFLRNEGFRGNLKYLRGEFDFLVNKFAIKGNLSFVNSEEGTLIEPTPTEKSYRDKRLFYIEDRKHLARSISHRVRFNIDQWALYLNYIAIIVAGILGWLTSSKIILGAVFLSLLITIILRCVIFNKRSKSLGVIIPVWKVIPYEIIMVWHKLKVVIMYRRANKYDFISHKL